MAQEPREIRLYKAFIREAIRERQDKVLAKIEEAGLTLEKCRDAFYANTKPINKGERTSGKD